VGVCGEKEKSAPGVASPLTCWDRDRQGPARGRSKEPLRDAKEREQSRDADTVLRYTASPAFPKPATTTPPTLCERRRSLLHLFPSLVSALC
jgi:hypothetical protein